MTSTALEQTPAQQIAAQFTPSELYPRRHDACSVDMLAMAAAHVRHGWGDYGYSIAVESVGFGWAMFRGHHSDGSDFYFVVDRYCNVADLPQSG